MSSSYASVPLVKKAKIFLSCCRAKMGAALKVRNARLRPEASITRGMIVARRRYGRMVVVVAACLFFLQVVSGGLSPFSGSQLDAFGNPLCLSSDDANSKGPESERGTVKGCCLGGCCTSSQLIGANSSLAWIPASLLSLDTRQRLSMDEPYPAQDHHPGFPRAPPSSAIV
ncbi:hypothetical protein D9M68_174760 [compost metagenome]